MTRRAETQALAAAERLFVSGVVAEDGRSVLLLSPDEPAFWPHFRGSPEARDGVPDPLDRWSARVIGAIAAELGGEALFPFGGPPWQPFTRWPLESGEAWVSPVGLIVHHRMGLFASFRGAIALAEDIAPDPQESPCPACPKPCTQACPAGAFAKGAYDVPRCKAFLETQAGRDCMEGGCLVRRACPVGQSARDPAQSAFHMRAFHPDAA